MPMDMDTFPILSSSFDLSYMHMQRLPHHQLSLKWMLLGDFYMTSQFIAP